jgi:hypothetical protein
MRQSGTENEESKVRQICNKKSSQQTKTFVTEGNIRNKNIRNKKKTFATKKNVRNMKKRSQHEKTFA